MLAHGALNLLRLVYVQNRDHCRTILGSTTLRLLFSCNGSQGVIKKQLCAIRLLLIRSPKFSRDFGFLWFCSRTKRFYIHPNPNPNPNHNPEAIHNPNHNPNPNPSPKQSNSCLTSLSRDQNSFLPITLQGSIFTIRHGG